MVDRLTIKCPHCNMDTAFELDLEQFWFCSAHPERRLFGELEEQAMECEHTCGNCHQVYYATLLRKAKPKRGMLIDLVNGLKKYRRVKGA